MDSLLVLFCDVDDFCKGFLPIWQQQQLAGGRQHRQRARSLTGSEITPALARRRKCVHPDCLSPVALSRFQSLLLRAGAEILAGRVPRICQLYPVCGIHPVCACPAGDVPA